MAAPRVAYNTLNPAAYKALVDLTAAVKSTDLDVKLIDLVFQRVSQINGCAYCVDLHWHDLIAAGEDLQRLNSLATWREVNFFSERERAALNWAERVTGLAQAHPSDEDYAHLHEQFSEAEVATLTYTIAAMNAWNRMAVALKQPVVKKAVRLNGA